jgi:hypothetical protein
MSRILSLIHMELSEKLYAPVALSPAQDTPGTFDKDESWAPESSKVRKRQKYVPAVN